MGKSGDMKDPMLRGVMHLREQDEVIDRIAEEHGNPGFPGSYTPFESMVRAILSQQISGAAARTIIGRVEAVAGGITTPESVAMLSADELRRCGVSAQKSRYLASLIDHVDRGLIDFDTIARLEDDEIVSQLTAVTGIGVWTAKMFLIFNLGRLDVLPHEDLGVRNGIMRAYGLAEIPGKREIERIAEERNWSPYRSIASWYMWRATEA